MALRLLDCMDLFFFTEEMNCLGSPLAGILVSGRVWTPAVRYWPPLADLEPADECRELLRLEKPESSLRWFYPFIPFISVGAV